MVRDVPHGLPVIPGVAHGGQHGTAVKLLLHAADRRARVHDHVLVLVSQVQHGHVVRQRRQHAEEVDVVDPEDGREESGLVEGWNQIPAEDDGEAAAVVVREPLRALKMPLVHHPFAVAFPGDGHGVPHPHVAKDGALRVTLQKPSVAKQNFVRVEEHVVVHLDHVAGSRAVLRNPAEAEHALEGEVLVRVEEVALDGVLVQRVLERQRLL